jgi:Papain fold toxin 1, glutamine deamidase
MPIFGEFLYYGGDAHLVDVNPDFYPEGTNSLTNPYRINCVSCAIATDSNLAGVNVKASPFENRQDIKGIQNIYGRKFEYILKSEEKIHRKDVSRKIEILSDKKNLIEAKLRSTGEESRAIIYVEKYVPGQPTLGHVFNVWNRGKGVIEFLDGQNNKIVTDFHPGIAIISLLQTEFVNQK